MKSINLIIILSLLLYCTYSVKVKSNSKIDIFPGHTPKSIERLTGGLIECKWFPNPHHCK